jgi:glycine/sarcosine N-methyltransferase
MSLYEGIAAWYDLVFPLRESRVAYALSLATEAGSSVLDVGCATGALDLALARHGRRVTGIDLDQEMIRLARERAQAEGLRVTFEVADMLGVAERLAGSSYDAILCLGNTIVHLAGAVEVRSFLSGSRGLLARGGRIALQLLNYERVLRGLPPPLPVIENEILRFVRSYDVDAACRGVRFSTELTLKRTGDVRRDETQLYPLTLAEILAMLAPCGLALEACHADFSGRPFAPEDGSLIAVARKA